MVVGSPLSHPSFLWQNYQYFMLLYFRVCARRAQQIYTEKFATSTKRLQSQSH